MSGVKCSIFSAERQFPIDEIVALASARSINTEISFGDKVLKCKVLENYDFTGTDICLMSAGGDVSREWSPKIGKQGCVVIDNSSAWRMDPDVPLIVPEVNADAIEGFSKKNIIANPNCSTAQLVVALKPLHDKAMVKRVVVSTYQSVSGAGKDAMDELFAQTRAIFVSDSVESKKFPSASPSSHSGNRRLHGGRLYEGRMEDDGRDEENAGSKDQAHRNLRAGAGLHRPFESVNVEFENPIRRRRSARHSARGPGLSRIDKHEPGGYITPHEAAGEDATYISRIREDATVENGLVSGRRRQSPQRRGLERGPDCGGADQPQTHRAEKKAA